MSILCMALHELGIEAVSLTGSQAGIITNDRHNDAQVIEVRPFRVQDEMARGRVVVVGGFQGVSYRRDITTLGRGGSDTTAVALAAALNADRCEIYSDVDGVYTADPSVVADAKHLPEISYQVMQEMSAAGAKVLNAQAVQFAKEKQIALYARSTFDHARETIVKKLSAGAVAGVQAVVSENDITRIRIHGDRTMKHFYDTAHYLEEEQVPVKEVNVVSAHPGQAGSKASLVASSLNVYGWEEIKQELKKRIGEAIEFDTDLSALSLIGEGINRSSVTLLETMNLLQSHGIEIQGIVTTSFRISLLVPREHIKESMLLCHKKWVSDPV
jgi:aspartate kinase